jgi:hypothetical protein
MKTPYDKYRNNPLWTVLEQGINDLVANQDIEITTVPDYVIGYLVKMLTKQGFSNKNHNDSGREKCLLLNKNHNNSRREKCLLINHPEYTTYISCKHSGLRKEAMKHLDAFLASCINWNQTDKRAFVKAFFTEQSYEECQFQQCFPLVSQLLYPVLHDWYKEKPDDYLPYYGFAFIFAHASVSLTQEQLHAIYPPTDGMTVIPTSLESMPEYKASKRALELAPDNDDCRRIYIELLIKWLGDEGHDHYSGCPDMTFPQKELEEVEHQLKLMKESPVKDGLEYQLTRTRKFLSYWEAGNE